MIDKVNRISILESEKLKMGLRIKSLESQVSSLNEEIGELKENDLSINDKNEAMICKIKLSEAKIKKLSENLKEEQSINKQLLNLKESLENEINDLMQNKIEGWIKKEEEYVKERKSMQLRINRLETECQRLSLSLNDKISGEHSEDSISNYEKLLLLLEDERKAKFDLERSLIAEENKRLILLNEKENLEAEILSLKSQKNTVDINAEKIVKIKNEISRMQTHINEIISGFNQVYFKTLDAYREKLIGYENLELENEGFKKNCLAVRKEDIKESCWNEDLRLIKLLNEKEVEVTLLNKKIVILSKSAEEAEELASNEIDMLRKNIEELNSKVYELENKLNEKTSDKFNFEKLVKGYKRKLDSKMQEVDEKNEKIKIIESKKDEMAAQIIELEQNISKNRNLEEENLCMKSNQEKLKLQFNDLSCLLEKMKSRNHTLTCEIKDLKKTNFNCNHSFFESRIEQLLEKVSDLENKLFKTSEDLRSLKKTHQEQTLKVVQMQRISDENSKLIEFFKPLCLFKKANSI